MLPARLQRAYGVIYTFEPMGKPIGYDPARLQRAYLPIKGPEQLQKVHCTQNPEGGVRALVIILLRLCGGGCRSLQRCR